MVNQDKPDRGRSAAPVHSNPGTPKHLDCGGLGPFCSGFFQRHHARIEELQPMLTYTLMPTALAAAIATPVVAASISRAWPDMEVAQVERSYDVPSSKSVARGGTAPNKNQEMKSDNDATNPPSLTSAIDILTHQGNNQIISDKLIGMPVVGPERRQVGKISSLIVETNGRIAGVIVSVGGFLGTGDRKVALPFDKIRIEPGQEKAAIALSQKLLAEASEFRTIDRAPDDATGTRQEQRRPGAVPGGSTLSPPPAGRGGSAK